MMLEDQMARHISSRKAGELENWGITLIKGMQRLLDFEVKPSSKIADAYS